MKRRVSFLSKRKCWKKNQLSKWFPIKGTHCTVWCEQTSEFQLEIGAAAFLPLFATRPNVFWCILLTRWHSHLPRSDLTAVGIGSPRGETGRGGVGASIIIHPICLLCLFQAAAKCSRSGRGWRGGLLSLCQLLFELQASNLSTASSSLLFKCSNSQSMASLEMCGFSVTPT